MPPTSPTGFEADTGRFDGRGDWFRDEDREAFPTGIVSDDPRKDGLDHKRSHEPNLGSLCIVREQDRKQEASFPNVQTLRSCSASTPE